MQRGSGPSSTSHLHPSTCFSVSLLTRASNRTLLCAPWLHACRVPRHTGTEPSTSSGGQPLAGIARLPAASFGGLRRSIRCNRVRGNANTCPSGSSCLPLLAPCGPDAGEPRVIFGEEVFAL